MGESADSVYMYGYWNPSNRSWSGHWSQDKHLQGSSYEFSYAPKSDTSVLPKNPCENCRTPLIDKENVKNCAMCDRNGVHLTCVTQNPYYCMSCLDITRKYGQVPPVARSWYGYFELAGEQGQTIRYDDIMRLDFNYNHKSEREAIVAAIIGKGENVFGTFVLKGYLIRAKRSGDATGDMLEIKLLKHYEVPSVVPHNPALNLKVPYSVAPAAVPINPAVSVNASASSMSRQRRRPDGEEFGLDDDELGRNRKRPKTSLGKRIPKTATFIASVGVEGNIVNLVDVWRTVSSISDPNLTVVCLSAPSASLPLKSILRVHQSNEQVATTLRSSSAMAACSAACQAVDAAIENQGVAISCASLDRKSQHSLPCAVAATYASERYSRAVAVVDLCPQPMLLASALKTIPTITTFTAQRDGNDVRGWRQGIHAVVDSIARQQFDILFVSMVLSEFDNHDYGFAMEILGSVGVPMVVVFEDVSSARAKDCARAVVETLLRKFDNSDSSSSSIEPLQSMPNPIPFSSYSAPVPSLSTSHLTLGGGPTPPPGSSSSGYPKSNQPMGMYQSLMKPTPPPVSQQGQQHPGVKVAPGGGGSGGGSGGDKSKMLQPGQSYAGIKQPGVMPPMHMQSSSSSASSQSQQKPSLGMTVTAPNISRSGNPMGGQPTPSQLMNKSGPKPPAGVANGGSGIYGQSVGQNRSNGSSNPYPTPPNLQKQSSGSMMSTNPMPSIAPSQVKKPIDSGRTSSPKRQVSSSYGGQGSAQDQHPMYELPPDMLEPLPYTRDSSFAESMPEPQNPSPPQPVNNVQSAPAPASTVPQALTIPTPAPPLERQDSWDMGMESPRPNGNNNNKFDYITASFKS